MGAGEQVCAYDDQNDRARVIEEQANSGQRVVEVRSYRGAGTDTFRLTKNLFIWVFLAGSSSIVLAYSMRHAVVDDAYIYLQVARNFKEGFGWSFNKNELSNPCTGPMYVLFLASLLRLGIPGEAALLLSFSLSTMIGACILFRLFDRADLVFAVASSTIFLTSTTLLTACGLETGWFFVGVLGAIWCYQKRRWLRLGLLLGILHLFVPTEFC